MSSPMSELLVQEGLCTDLFKTISESVEASSHNNLEVATSMCYSDDVIGQLLDQMVQILPPEERNIFGCTEEKNIEEIIQEANELIRATTPLFSSSESAEKSWNKSQKSLSKTLKTIESSSIKSFSEEVTNCIKEKSENDSICSSLESILVKEADEFGATTDQGSSLFVEKLKDTGGSEIEKENCKSILKRNKEFLLHFVDEPLPLKTDNMTANDSSRALETMPTNDENRSVSHKIVMGSQQSIKSFSEPRNGKHSPQEKPAGVADENKKIVSPEVVPKNKKVSDPGLEIELIKQTHMAEVQELKLSHTKAMHVLTEQINGLNFKIYQYQKETKIEKGSDIKNQQLERFENEIKNQEQLLAGYERENQKLCKEISSLKEVWKQRESKLLEDKQRLQKELLGMVSKSTTEALEEQLKDARETIVKLQIELTTYKSKNKELEVQCERLRGESHRLQAELGNCRCERTVSRRDKYSFLASSNVGEQIQELKNVIARKDVEISQMSTTMSILKGELSNRDLSVPGMYNQQLEHHSLTISQLQTALAVERQNAKELVKEKELLLKDNLDLKRQVRELESIVRRRQRSDSCFPVTVTEAQSSSRLAELEKELSTRQESLSTLHTQFLSMQKKYEEHIHELEERLKECKEELQTLKKNQKKEEASHSKSNIKKFKQGTAVVKEETHLLATIRGLRQEAATREKEINKLNKEVEEVRQTNKRLQKEREKQLNSMPTKMSSTREKSNLRKVDKTNSAANSRPSTSPNTNNNINPLLFTELQESNLILKSKTKSLQEEVKKLEQDLIAMHNKRVHDLTVVQSEHEVEMSRLLEERATFLSQSSETELQGQVYTQQMVINHLKNRLKQMEELKNEVTLLRAERDHLEQNLGAVNKKMCYLQNDQSPESIQYKTLLAKLETLEKNQEIREQKLNTVRELLSRSTQGQGQCGGTCRDKLLDKNRQICFYRAQMDRILEALLEIRRTK